MSTECKGKMSETVETYRQLDKAVEDDLQRG
jgi:hypothetical protein